MNYPEKPQLYMIWPQNKVVECESILPIDYSIRSYKVGDEEKFLGLMGKLDFDPWDEDKLKNNMAKIIPEGWFFVEDKYKEVIATAMCLHNYSGQFPFRGDVGWLACDPEHRGQGIGYVLAEYVTKRFLSAGYSCIQLSTEYYRLPAIKIYLTLGYRPVLYSTEIVLMWQDICNKLDWEYTPNIWNENLELCYPDFKKIKH